MRRKFSVVPNFGFCEKTNYFHENCAREVIWILERVQDELELDGVRIENTSNPNCYYDFTENALCFNFSYWGGDFHPNYRACIRYLTLHEARHVYQCRKKMMIFNADFTEVTWVPTQSTMNLDQIARYIELADRPGNIYEKLPQEVDANSYAYTSPYFEEISPLHRQHMIASGAING